MANEMNVLVPDIGDFSGVAVIELLVQPGDRVKPEQSLLTLESDKAAMEIPSPQGGVVRSLAVKVGDKVNKGDLILVLEVEESDAAPAVPAAVEPPDSVPPEEVEAVTAPEPEPAPAPMPQLARAPGEKVPATPPVTIRPSDMPASKGHASPSIRRFARELGVDVLQVTGSGPKGRVTREDVQNYVKRVVAGGAPTASRGGPLQLPAIPEVDFAQYGEIEAKPLPRIKKISGAHLHACWLNVPHVTQFDEADITELEAFRQQLKEEAAKQEIRLTLIPFVLKAVVTAMRELPEINASLAPDGENLIYKRYFHIGVAVNTPNGLVVPVVRNVDRKGVFELAQELQETSERARKGKLTADEMRGGCFTISSLGGIGGTAFTPIVNAPEVAILGLSRSQMKPVWNGKEFAPRLMLPLSLSYDHRVIDGVQGVRFTTRLAQLLGDIRRLML